MTTLSLTTAIKDTAKFTVDGAEFQLYDMDHLSPDEESRVLALFSRFSNIAAELDGITNVLKGKDLADRLRLTREAIIEAMTDMPKDLVGKLPLSQQALLVEAMQAEMEEQNGSADGAVSAPAETKQEALGLGDGV